jgi:hypothetical protein
MVCVRQQGLVGICNPGNSASACKRAKKAEREYPVIFHFLYERLVFFVAGKKIIPNLITCHYIIYSLLISSSFEKKRFYFHNGNGPRGALPSKVVYVHQSPVAG